MGSVIMTDTGIVKFFNGQYGYVKTRTNGDIRIGGNIIGSFGEQLVEKAIVELSFVEQTHKGKTGYNATRIKSVTPPPAPAPRLEPIIVLATVDWFDAEEGFGFVNFAEQNRFESDSAILRLATCEEVGFLPTRDDRFRVKVNQKPSEKGPVVSYFWHGAKVDAEWDAKMAELYGEDCDIGDVRVDETPASDPFFALFEQHAEDTMRDIGQKPAPAEPEPKPAKAKAKKAVAAKPKGKVTGKSGGIPSAKDYGVHPDDIASMAAHQCAKGGGSLAQAMLAATTLN